MKKIFNLSTILGLSFLGLFIVLLLLLNVDKDYITLTGKVGLSSFNNLYDYEYHKWWQVTADIFLYLGIALVVALAGYGVYELIKRKSLFKVDKYIIVIGVFFVVAIILWLLFDKAIVVNYRPIFVDGKRESSFPSTHTFVVIFIYMSAYIVIQKLTQRRWYKEVVLAVGIAISIIVAVSRVVSGMHYLTDMIGGVFLGLSLYFLCDGVIKALDNKKEEI